MNYKGVKDRVFTCLNCKKEFKYKTHSHKHMFCNQSCHNEYTRATWLKENEEKFQQGTLPSRRAIKKFVEIRDGNKCAVCGQPPEHNGERLVMILDHIDGNATNNAPSNFRLVCPNCDSQQPTYKSRNRGKGRASHGLPWFHQV
jgi:Zn finger protein HypA/HybF involved in hydrogenase expression